MIQLWGGEGGGLEEPTALREQTSLLRLDVQKCWDKEIVLIFCCES